MISAHYICNGCGVYTSYAGKNEKQLNEIKVDLTNYLLFTSGLSLKSPEVAIHFCDKCFSQIQEGEIKIRAFGSVEQLRRQLEERDKQLYDVNRKFEAYKNKVSSLIKEGNL